MSLERGGFFICSVVCHGLEVLIGESDLEVLGMPQCLDSFLRPGRPRAHLPKLLELSL